MGLFDLLFILLFLVAVANVITIGVLIVRKRFQSARRVVLRLLVGASLYFAVVILVSAILPRRILQRNEPLCFDDWCIAVANITSAPQEPGQIAYRIEFNLSSRARRVTQRENNLAAYISSSDGQRFNPVSGAGFNAPLAPGQTVTVSQNFVIPATLREPGLMIHHEGGFPVGWFIIGYDAWFRKPPVLTL